MLDTLVKLASIGASGICIFAIFWVGHLISRMSKEDGAEKHRTMRFFIGACVLIAIISAVTGIANAYFNAQALMQEKEKTKLAQEEVGQKTTQLAKVQTDLSNAQATLRVQETKNKEVASSLTAVLRAKELVVAEQNNAELKRHVGILKNSVERLKNPLDGPH